jgi:hypothetical protein
MTFRVRPLALFAAVAAVLVLSSCAKKEKDAETGAAGSAAGDSTLKYVSDEVSFGAFFDAAGTKRTIEVKGAKETKLYIVVSYPATMQIAAVEWRLVLPEGVTVEYDKFYDRRAALLGTFEDGMSETFPCVAGPKLVLHELVLNVPAGIKNGEVALMPSHSGKILAVATCDEGYPIVEASAYKAIINPTD